MNVEGSFFGSLLSGGRQVSDLRLVQKTWLTDEWKPVYDFVLSFVQQHGNLPRLETVEGQVGYPMPRSAEEPAYWAEHVRLNAMRLHMDMELTDKVASPLSQSDTIAAQEGLRQVVHGLHGAFPNQRPGLILNNIGDDVQARMEAYLWRQRTKSMGGLPLPWPALTRNTGGLQAGDFWVILGRPNQGKTWAAIVIAMHLYQLGLDVLYVSMETPPFAPPPKNKNHRVVNGRCIRCFGQGVDPSQECDAAKVPKQRLSMRFDAVGSRISAWRFVKGLLTPLEEERLKQYYTYISHPQCQYGRLRVVSSPAVKTVADLEMEAMAMQPDVIIFDSGYLAADHVWGNDQKERAAKMLGQFKDTLDRTSTPGILTWHFNREVDENATRASMNNASMSDEIGKVADIILGLFRPPEMDAAGEALWRTLKVREGLPLRELRTFFRVKEEMNFAEIAEAMPGH